MDAKCTVRLILPGLLVRSYEEAREEIFRRCTERYGGVTTWRGRGWWDDGPDNSPLSESIVICECAVSSWNTEDRQFWGDLADYAREKLHQKAIMLTVYHGASSWLIDDDLPEKRGA